MFFRLPCSVVAFDEFLYVVQLAECLEGREVVDVQTEYFVAYLAENRVVELEEVELHPTVCCPLPLVRCTQLLMVDGSFEFLQDDVCPCHDGSWHACKFRHVYAETVFRTATGQFA